MDWDVFISHAWEDKEDIARPLAEALRRRGLRVWYDEFTLTLGDSLRRSIDRGLAQSRYGVVILSPNFFAKEWPQRELDGLVAREVSSGKTILPVWHNVTREDVSRFSPPLADKLAVSTTKGLDAVVEEILRALRIDLKSEATREEHRPSLPSVAKRTLAKPQRPVNLERVGAIVGVIAVIIALGAWLVPNVADYLSAWLSKTPTAIPTRTPTTVAAITKLPTDTPTVTPTSSPTRTPVISTATPTNTPFSPTATPTFTPAPPTPTQVLPTDTPTPILPTPTLAPPTATPVVPAPTPHLTGKIAYVMSDGIWVMDADGSNRRRVHEGRNKIPFISGGEPVLSPDGSKIAFIRREGGPEDGLWVMDVNGSGIQQIVSSGRISSTSWAPDSNQIVYTETSGAGYIVKIPDGMPQSVSGQMWSPAWSPDGDWFAGPTEQGLVKRPVWGGPQLVLDSSTDWWATQPAWSPDGTRIVYLKEGDIFAINADGSGRTRLTDHPALDRYPYWSPGGSKIVFVTDRDGNNEIYVMNPDGSDQMNLTNSAEDEWRPSWAP